jgi:hypothetical protein
VTAHELAAILAHCTEDLPIVVETAQGGIPTRRMVDVRSAAQGFDWTSRWFLIRTAEPVVVVRVLKGRTEDLARKRLDELKSGYAQVGQRYIAKAREQEWIDGFVEGVRAHVTSANEEVDP